MRKPTLVLCLVSLAGAMGQGNAETGTVEYLLERYGPKSIRPQAGRWAFKYHALFPLLATLRHADHYVRFIYPCSYALVIAMWSWSWSAGE